MPSVQLAQVLIHPDQSRSEGTRRDGFKKLKVIKFLMYCTERRLTQLEEKLGIN